MTGLILKLSYKAIGEREPMVTSLSECFFVTKNIIACAHQGVNALSIKPENNLKYCKCFILINGFSIPFTAENIYEYQEVGITFIVLSQSYDIAPVQCCKDYKHLNEIVYCESLKDALNNVSLRYSWENRTLNIRSHNLEKYYCTNHGMGGINHLAQFVSENSEGNYDKPEILDPKNRTMTLTIHFEGKPEREAGSPVFSAKTKEFIGMLIVTHNINDGSTLAYSAITSYEFIKLMLKVGITVVKKPWYKRWR